MKKIKQIIKELNLNIWIQIKKIYKTIFFDFELNSN